MSGAAASVGVEAGLAARAMRALVSVAQIVAGVMLAAIVIINAANVAGRYVFSKPIDWAEEVMLFLMIGGVFLSNIGISLDGAHIRMDVLLRALPPLGRRLLDLLADLLTIAVAVTLAWVGSDVVSMLAQFGQTSDAAGIPVAIPQSVIPLSFGLTALALIVRLISGAGPRADDSDEAGEGSV
jgi:TRAP-type C4-dicarboxylate transport system permease small subunit